MNNKALFPHRQTFDRRFDPGSNRSMAISSGLVFVVSETHGKLGGIDRVTGRTFLRLVACPRLKYMGFQSFEENGAAVATQGSGCRAA